MTAVGRARATVPEPLREQARRLLARRLERKLRRSAAVRGAAIVYHGVAERAGDHRFEIDPPIARRGLEAAVAHLARNYSMVHAADLPQAACRRAPGEPIPVAMTFDDDLPSHLDQAAPVFERHGAAATVFLCGAEGPFWWQLLQAGLDEGSVDSLPGLPPDLVSRARAREPGAAGRLAAEVERLPPGERDRLAEELHRAVTVRPPVLGRGGAAELAARGWEVGFHTRGHYLLSTLDEERLRQETEPPANGRARSFAYPHGKAGEREASAVGAAGYDAAYTGRAEPFTEATDPRLIGRLQPDTVTVGRFALQLARALTDT